MTSKSLYHSKIVWSYLLETVFRNDFALLEASRWISSRLPALFGWGSRWRALNWPSRVAVRSPFSDQNWELLDKIEHYLFRSRLAEAHFLSRWLDQGAQKYLQNILNTTVALKTSSPQKVNNKKNEKKFKILRKKWQTDKLFL